MNLFLLLTIVFIVVGMVTLQLSIRCIGLSISSRRFHVLFELLDYTNTYISIISFSMAFAMFLRWLGDIIW